MGWSAADWIEGAGGCIVEVLHTREAKHSSDWVEGGCYLEAWRDPLEAIYANRAVAETLPVEEKPSTTGQLRPSIKAEKPKPAAKRAGGLTLHYDFVVIGSGIAGLKYALTVAEHGTVAIVTKAEAKESNTNYAQGGIASVLDTNDSVENHIQDTIVAGAFLCEKEAVEVVCREGPDRVKELMALGADFDRDAKTGELHLAREGGHSHNRIVHATDLTGREVERALLAAVAKNPNIRVFEQHFAVDLLTRAVGNSIVCCGVDVLNNTTSEVVRILASSTMLASGGAGHVYPSTTNPLVATGDGMALAYRAKAIIANMEFVQFHPTALADAALKKGPKRSNAFLITEAVRGAGGILYNQDGERFMPLYDEREELAPRDVVARAIDDQLKKRNEKFVYLDISQHTKEEILSHFPNIAVECLKHGIDITKQPIPVVPAAHYMCGGVQADLQGQTSIKGLWACGEVAYTGLHGANRLASNSLLEALVFAHRAAGPSVKYAAEEGDLVLGTPEEVEALWPRATGTKGMTAKQAEEVTALAAKQRRRMQDIMYDYVGIVRTTERLRVAQRELTKVELAFEDRLKRLGWQSDWVSQEVCELRNLLAVAHMVVKSAAKRQESRGLHYITDFKESVESERHATFLYPSKQLLAKRSAC